MANYQRRTALETLTTRPQITEAGRALLQSLCRMRSRRYGVLCDRPIAHKGDHEGTENVPSGRHAIRRRWAR